LPQGKIAILAEGIFQRSVTEQRSLSISIPFEIVLRSQARRKLNQSLLF
jgi:hypothetical protein